MATPPVFVSGTVLLASEMNAIGLWKTGTATGTTVSTLSINNVFNTDFLVYRAAITITAATGSQTFSLRFRASGTDNSAADYNFYNRVSASNTGADTNNFNRAQTIAPLISVNTDQQGFNLDIQRPFTASPTYVGYNATGNVGNMVYGAISHDGNDSFDGFTITTSTGTFSATVTVYGYRN